MTSLKQRIVDYIVYGPKGERYTNGDLAAILGAPQPSVRRATLQAMSEGLIDDGGPTTYNPKAVTYVAPEASL